MVLLGLLGILASPVTEVVKCLAIPVGRQFQYIIQYKTNTDELREQLKGLVLKRDGVNESSEAARKSGKSTLPEVHAWIERVNSLHAKATEFLDDGSVHERANSSCILGCPSRHRIGKKAKKMVNKANKLKMEGEFNVIAERVPPRSRDVTPSEDFEVFDVTKKAMEAVMEGLKNPKVSLIAVHGIPGVGKTALMEEVGKQARREGLFDEDVMATVSQKIDFKKIQGEIAENLGLTLKEETESARAKRLFGLLKKDPRRILIILDDLWQRIELSKVGIPPADDHSRCKVVITTRSQDVCSDMAAQANVELELLSEKDSLFLFRKKTGDIVDPSSSTVIQDVANECERLPLAIVTLGRALRGKNQQIWVDTLSKLRKSICTGIGDMNAAVFQCIRKSYDILEDEPTKLCFLLCGLFPEDCQISIEVLMWYMVVELSVDIGTLEDARAMVRGFCNKLEGSNLLLKGRTDDEFVMMHDVIRDVAIFIARENGFLPLSYSDESIQCLERNALDIFRISVMNTKVELPSQPVCPNLLMLLLRNNKSLADIPNSFFAHLNNLTVLDLSYNSISVLPQSISCITQLRTLLLESCSQLKDVSMIGKLKNLEVVSLKGTSIEILPEEIGGLTKLRLLNLSCTKNLKSIPPKVISNLSCLEELDMSKSFSGWEAEVGDGINASLCEVTSLTSLTTLYIHVENVKCLSMNIPNNNGENLRRFGISFGDRYWGSDAVRSMCLNTSSSVSNWVKVLLDKTEELKIVSCNDLKNVAQLNPRGFNNLKSLHIKDCHGLDYIVGGEEDIQKRAFFGALEILEVEGCHKLVSLLSSSLLSNLQNLEALKVYDCSELTNVFEYGGPKDGQGAFPKLKVLYLRKLHRLRYVFSPAMIQGLQQLEKIKIESCDEMVTLISEDDDEQPTTSVPRNGSRDLDSMSFASLRTLRLWQLLKLSSLYQGQRDLVWPSLEELVIFECPNLKTLVPFSPQNAPKLTVIRGYENWFSGLGWSDESVKLHFQPLFQDSRPKLSLPPKRRAIKIRILEEFASRLCRCVH